MYSQKNGCKSKCKVLYKNSKINAIFFTNIFSLCKIALSLTLLEDKKYS